MTPDSKSLAAGTQRFRPLVPLALWYVAAGLILRLILWWLFGRPAQVGFLSLFWILPAGIIADAIQSLYLLLPMAAFLWVIRDQSAQAPWSRILMYGGTWLFCAFFGFIAATEYFFFEEFDSRFNLVSVDYLIYPTEVAGDIWAEYPIVMILIAMALLALLFLFLLRKRVPIPRQPTTFWARTMPFTLFASALCASLAFFSTNTLGLSRNRVANELAANGPSSFFRALRTSEIDYHAFYATGNPAENLKLLVAQGAKAGEAGGQYTRLPEGRIDRVVAPRPTGLGKMNVVVISSESFGAEFSKLYGSDRDWTPEFDALARQSLWFRHTYASGTRTVRGLEAISASLPPIPTESIIRRPGNGAAVTWGEVLAKQGYRSSFLYGGYGYFDNMNEFYQNNGYEVLDRNQIPKPHRFENIWGVSDEDLFDTALHYFDAVAQSGKPFFSQIMTTSNHKPYTFRSGLESKGIKPTGGGRESGVRYADYAQGYFMREAAKHSWFSNTLFVIIADHGARVYGKQEIPLKTYEIPLLIYAPGKVQPREVDSLMTQVDLAPTVMGLLGLGYTAPWFGQDALNTPEESRLAYFGHNHDVAVLRGDTLAILGLQKTVHDKHYDPATDQYQDVPPDPALNRLAIATYQTAYELFRAKKLE
jgi:phosphoglycerol transferase MdoB-like AlkP superfamily enzyme